MPKLVGYARRGSGLMGLGQVPDDQAPIQVGNLAKNDPIFSSASVMASAAMLKMASVAKVDRLNEMVAILNKGQPGLGDATRANFLRLVARKAPGEVDQTMFDVLRAAFGNVLVAKTFALSRGVSGLGQTIAEARGQTSQGVNDANALFCSFGAGTFAMVGGTMDQFGLGSGGTSGGAAGSMIGGARAGGAIAGCGAGALVIQNEASLAAARLSQSGTAQALAMQQAQEARMMRYAMMGGGGLLVLVVVVSILKK